MKDKKIFIGLFVSLGFLWLSLKGVNWNEVRHALTKMNYLYLVPIILSSIFAQILRAIRWRSLLIRIKNIRLYDLFSILMVANLLSILPARIGEVIRAYLLGKKHDISKTACFSTIVLERAFDGLFTISAFVIALWLYPGDINVSITGHAFSVKKAIYSLSVIYVATFTGLILIKAFPEHFSRLIRFVLHYFSEPTKIKVDALLMRFISGLSVLQDFRHLIFSLILTGIVWTAITCTYYLGLLGFGIESQFYLSFILMGFIIIAVMIPAAPGSVGVFHFAVQLTLMKFFNVSPSTALSYAWVMWTCGLVTNI